MISLRPIESDDAKELYALFSLDPELKSLDLPLSSLSAFEKWINELLAHEFLGFGLARVINTADRQIAGLILLTSIDHELGQAEIGTWIGLPFRGKGINGRAKQDMLEYAFIELNLKVVFLYTAETNLVSIKALKKLPYVTLPDQKIFEEELKHRRLLHSRSFMVYEVRKELFFRWDAPAK